jgi:hypothetical protein
MNYLKLITFSFGMLFCTSKLIAQLSGLSTGLAFSSGVEYNAGNTGNPGLFLKAYIKVNKNFHVVPSFTVYSKYSRSDFNKELNTYMFQGDIDAAINFYNDKALRVVGFTGINATALISKWDINYDEGLDLVDKSDLKPGLNLGGALQLFVSDSFDAYISAKYIVSSFNMAVINIGAIYYLGDKRRRGSW